jgi:hypothetical protein
MGLCSQIKRERRNTPPATGSAAGVRRFAIPPNPCMDNLINISILPEAAPPPPADADPISTDCGNGPGSRANAVKSCFRSKLLFTPDLYNLIAQTYERLAAQMKPDGVLQEYLVRDLARCMVQDERASDRLLLDDLRVIERAGTCHDIDAAARTERLAAKLRQSASLTAGILSRSKHGAMYLINQWLYIEEIIKNTSGLDEEQRQVCFDLLGIDCIMRRGSPRVPHADDSKALLALVSREINRHRANLARHLNDCDASEQEMAKLGIGTIRDSATRNLRADQRRIRNRFDWLMTTFEKLRAGTDPATLIDPDTGKPVAPGPQPCPVKKPAPPAPEPPPPPPPPDSEPEAEPEPEVPVAGPEPSMPPLSEGISAELREVLRVATGSILGPKATPAAHAAGPPSSA